MSVDVGLKPRGDKFIATIKITKTEAPADEKLPVTIVVDSELSSSQYAAVKRVCEAHIIGKRTNTILDYAFYPSHSYYGWPTPERNAARTNYGLNPYSMLHGDREPRQIVLFASGLRSVYRMGGGTTDFQRHCESIQQSLHTLSFGERPFSRGVGHTFKQVTEETLEAALLYCLKRPISRSLADTMILLDAGDACKSLRVMGDHPVSDRTLRAGARQRLTIHPKGDREIRLEVTPKGRRKTGSLFSGILTTGRDEPQLITCDLS